MTLANKITLVRITITPLFFVLFQLAAQQTLNISISVQILILLSLFLLFIASELSDLLDGIVARRLGQVSGVGKLMDPFSDVLSRVTYFFCSYQAEIMPSWAFILILWREISMLFVRQLVQLSGQGPLPARWAGKVKAVVYFIAILLGLLLFLFIHWPGSAYESIVADLAASSLGQAPRAFSLDSTYYRSLALATYSITRAWLLPISFLISVVASWHAFILYLRDFMPTLRKLI